MIKMSERRMEDKKMKEIEKRIIDKKEEESERIEREINEGI